MARGVGNSKIHSDFSASGGRLSFTRDHASTRLEFGADDAGLDTIWYGETTAKYMHWIASSDVLDLSTASAMILFASGASTTTVKSSASAPAGYLNFYVTAISTRVFVPYYASA